jgi:hypothetical protein
MPGFGTWIASLALAAAVLSGAAPEARACADFNLAFVSPLGVGPVVDSSIAIRWTDTLDGPQATLDLLASASPVPTTTSHTFPDGPLIGVTLVAGLPAVATSSFTWDTSGVAAGTYLLYSAFHNATTNVLVLPFATVTVAHAGEPVEPAVLLTWPRSSNDVTGSAPLQYDARAAAGGSVDLFFSQSEDGSDATPIASGLPLGSAQPYDWDCSSTPAGPYVFKAVVHAPDAGSFTSLSPGYVLVRHPAPSPSSHCATTSGPLFPWLLALLLLIPGSRSGSGSGSSLSSPRR